MGLNLGMSELEAFHAYRTRMNERILSSDSKIIKRMYNLDTNTYKEGALDKKTKELLGLNASMVLRCGDCIKYHIEECIKAGATEAELIEVFEVAVLVGGTIVIPELRKAFEFMDEVFTNG